MMATYDVKTLYTKWERGELTAEMAIGHLIQRLLEVEKRLQALERGGDAPQSASPNDS